VLEAQRASETTNMENLPSPVSRKPVISASTSVASKDTEEQKEARLKILEDRIESIQADKERLEQLQRLTELEEVTKAEIMAVRRGEA
jgi:hypothetical protein